MFEMASNRGYSSHWILNEIHKNDRRSTSHSFDMHDSSLISVPVENQYSSSLCTQELFKKTVNVKGISLVGLLMQKLKLTKRNSLSRSKNKHNRKNKGSTENSPTKKKSFHLGRSLSNTLLSIVVGILFTAHFTIYASSSGSLSTTSSTTSLSDTSQHQ